MNKLKIVREAKGLTQAQLAEASGVSLRTIQKYESGYTDIRQAAVGKVAALAAALKVQIEDLI